MMIAMNGRMWIVAAALALAGCGLLPDKKDDTANLPAERLYANGHEALVTGNYSTAIKYFDGIESRFPYGRYAQQAILESAFASWRSGDTAGATAACDRFIRTYPNHASVDYAYYLKGLVYFREDQGLFGYVYELDLSERDPKQMRESFAAFKDLATRFPESRYAEDAQARMRYLSNALGMYEVHVARYYYNRGAYVAAINRAQASLTSYPRTASNEQALDILSKSYDKLGMPQLAQDSRVILEKTFPESAFVAVAPPKPWWKIW